MDWIWIGILAIIAGCVGIRAAVRVDGHHINALEAAIWLPLSVAFVYLSALSLKDRYAAVVAASITATSSTLATVFSFSPETGASTALLSACWFFYDRGWLGLAGGAAAIATLCRPEMFFLGLILLGYGIFEKKSQVGIGVAVYIVILITFITIAIWFHLQIPLPVDFTTHGPYTVLWSCGPGILWFFLPFVAELTNAANRNRWLPIVTWLILFVLAVCSMDRASSLTYSAPAFVASYIICAAGIARVLPSVAGDLPTPVYRYVMAALAVFGLICLRFTSDANASGELLRNLSQPTTSSKRAPQRAANISETSTSHKSVNKTNTPQLHLPPHPAYESNHLSTSSKGVNEKHLSISVHSNTYGPTVHSSPVWNTAQKAMQGKKAGTTSAPNAQKTDLKTSRKI
jgi:hypothetical protein